MQGLPDFTQIDEKGWFSLDFPWSFANRCQQQYCAIASFNTIGASFFALGLNLIPVFGIILGALRFFPRQYHWKSGVLWP